MALNYLVSLSNYIPETVMVVLMLGLILIESTYDDGENNSTSSTIRPILVVQQQLFFCLKIWG